MQFLKQSSKQSATAQAGGAADERRSIPARAIDPAVEQDQKSRRDAISGCKALYFFDVDDAGGDGGGILEEVSRATDDRRHDSDKA